MRLILFCLSLVLVLPAAAQEADLAVVGGSVLDVREGTMSSANVLIGDGRILSVGPDAPPAGVETLDVSGKFVLPGFIDAHTHATE
ncbi:MAG: amidohydrolase, partial [Acidobacteriota bacterium]|nr:amidohydrolase [Acidobacteriota bacterium]